jgi:hypothetical protein
MHTPNGENNISVNPGLEEQRPNVDRPVVPTNPAFHEWLREYQGVVGTLPASLKYADAPKMNCRVLVGGNPNGDPKIYSASYLQQYGQAKFVFREGEGPITASEFVTRSISVEEISKGAKEVQGIINRGAAALRAKVDSASQTLWTLIFSAGNQWICKGKIQTRQDVTPPPPKPENDEWKAERAKALPAALQPYTDMVRNWPNRMEQLRELKQKIESLNSKLKADSIKVVPARKDSDRNVTVFAVHHEGREYEFDGSKVTQLMVRPDDLGVPNTLTLRSTGTMDKTLTMNGKNYRAVAGPMWTTGGIGYYTLRDDEGKDQFVLSCSRSEWGAKVYTISKPSNSGGPQPATARIEVKFEERRVD